MEPRTPPRSSRSRGTPAVPATPRFGTFEDLPDGPRMSSPPPSRSHRRKRSVNLFLTPRQTPKRRKDLRPSESVSERSSTKLLEATVEDEPDLDDDDCKRDLFGKPHEPESAETKAAVTRLRNTEKQTAIYHPHQDHPPPDVPGIWYAFRGKKIFRPLPPGEQRPEPVTLFKDILQSRGSSAATGNESGSEADTDVEE